MEKEIAKTLTAFLKKGTCLEKEKFFVDLFNLTSKIVLSELKVRFANPFPKRLMSILSIYLHYFGGCIRQIMRQI